MPFEEVTRAYLRDNSIVKQHIESYNKFLDYYFDNNLIVETKHITIA